MNSVRGRVGISEQTRWNRTTWCILLVAGVLIYGSHSILLTLCKVNGRIPFNSASVVVMIETTKFMLSLIMYLTDSAYLATGHRAQWSLVSSLKYAVPALLYGINNNIIVHVHDHMDPASCQILSNLKIVTTAVLYRLVIQKKLTWRQWMAIALLALAGMSYGSVEVEEPVAGNRLNQETFVTVTGTLLLMVHCIISGTTGVYMEYVLKRDSKVSLHIQNAQMYLYGISLNLLAYIYSTWHQGDIMGRLFEGYSIWTVVIIITQAVIGLIMSVIMKHGDNILRLFLISSAMVISTILSMLVFSLQLSSNFWLAFVMVLLALYMYYNKPMKS